MNGFKDRYFRRKTLELQCRTITPMFLGGADSNAEWRAAPFKSMLRYWWRVANGSLSTRDLLAAENSIFGSAGAEDGDSNGKSLVNVSVTGFCESTDKQFPRIPTVYHQEVEKNRNISPLLYLAAMGLMDTHGNAKRRYFESGCALELQIVFPENVMDGVYAATGLFQAFGAIGSRCRNGWGSFQVETGGLEKDVILNSLNMASKEWTDGFFKDYPNCLGKDSEGPLLWRTSGEKSWTETFRSLAETYISIRAGDDANNVRGLNPKNGERHLLGVPLTNHEDAGTMKFSKSDRHASPLRFVVRKKQEKYFGFILHVPHEFAKKRLMPRDKQVPIWASVHKSLDILMHRGTYEELINA
jgi:CRISPR-associated protein Cmr1